MEEKCLEVTRENNVVSGQKMNHCEQRYLRNVNCASVRGIIEEELEFSHETKWGDRIYKTRVRVTRKSGVNDFVPIRISEHLLNDSLKGSLKGKSVKVSGQFRSYDIFSQDDKRFHLNLFLFVTDINICEDGESHLEDAKAVNTIQLDGYLCKPPVYRTTPFGRKITDLMLAVKRNYNKTDYIPCVAWGINARYASNLNAGDRIKVYGRIQSREHFKRFSPDSEEGVFRTTYEVSINEMFEMTE